MGISVLKGQIEELKKELKNIEVIVDQQTNDIKNKETLIEKIEIIKNNIKLIGDILKIQNEIDKKQSLLDLESGVDNEEI